MHEFDPTPSCRCERTPCECERWQLLADGAVSASKVVSGGLVYRIALQNGRPIPTGRPGADPYRVQMADGELFYTALHLDGEVPEAWQEAMAAVEAEVARVHPDCVRIATSEPDPALELGWEVYARLERVHENVRDARLRSESHPYEPDHLRAMEIEIGDLLSAIGDRDRLAPETPPRAFDELLARSHALLERVRGRESAYLRAHDPADRLADGDVERAVAGWVTRIQETPAYRAAWGAVVRDDQSGVSRLAYPRDLTHDRSLAQCVCRLQDSEGPEGAPDPETLAERITADPIAAVVPIDIEREAYERLSDNQSAEPPLEVRAFRLLRAYMAPVRAVRESAEAISALIGQAVAQVRTADDEQLEHAPDVWLRLALRHWAYHQSQRTLRDAHAWRAVAEHLMTPAVRRHVERHVEHRRAQLEEGRAAFDALVSAAGPAGSDTRRLRADARALDVDVRWRRAHHAALRTIWELSPVASDQAACEIVHRLLQDGVPAVALESAIRANPEIIDEMERAVSAADLIERARAADRAWNRDHDDARPALDRPKRGSDPWARMAGEGWTSMSPRHYPLQSFEPEVAVRASEIVEDVVMYAVEGDLSPSERQAEIVAIFGEMDDEGAGLDLPDLLTPSPLGIAHLRSVIALAAALETRRRSREAGWDPATAEITQWLEAEGGADRIRAAAPGPDRGQTAGR